jgi:hypothetical protein
MASINIYLLNVLQAVSRMLIVQHLELGRVGPKSVLATVIVRSNKLVLSQY